MNNQMNVIRQRQLYAFTVGATAGATVGLVGWGGAQVIIPSMTASYPFAGLSQLAATGVSLSSLSVSTVTSGYKFWHDNRVDIPLALAIAFPSVISARVGSHLAKKMSGDALALFFNGFSIILIPTHFWIQQRKMARNAMVSKDSTTAESSSSTLPSTQCAPVSGNIRDIIMSSPTTYLQHASYGMISGIISSLMGVGGLPLTISYITEVTNLPHHYVQGTAVCAVIPSILVSAISRVRAIPMSTAGYVALGAMAGGYGGANAALHMTEEHLRIIYIGSLVVFGGRSVFGAAKNIKNICSKKL